MELFALLPAIIFLLGYFLITLEHRFGTHKSAIALALAAVLWVLASFSVDHHTLAHELELAGSEVFGIVAFLLAAMGLIEILNHYQFFNLIKTKLVQLNFNDRKQFLVIAPLTFFLSAILDNLTVTIVMTQIATRFFKGSNLLAVVAGVVILANAGGAWSPIGDVTTIMIWLADKFTATEVILNTILPSLVCGIVATGLIALKIKDRSGDATDIQKVKLSTGEKVVISACLVSFSFPIIMNQLGLQPYLGLLFGLGAVWLLIDFAKRRSQTPTHLEANIEKFLQNTDISSLKFFIGILLAVSALKALGILEQLSTFIYGEHQEYTRVIIGNIVLGAASSIVDNVPLTAIAIDMVTLKDPGLWSLLAFTVGTGGSLLVIGSVAGVVAAGIVKELTFGRYLKIATLPALFGYIAGVGFWLLQHKVFN